MPETADNVPKTIDVDARILNTVPNAPASLRRLALSAKDCIEQRRLTVAGIVVKVTRSLAGRLIYHVTIDTLSESGEQGLLSLWEFDDAPTPAATT